MSVLGVEGEEREDLNRAESRTVRKRSLRLLGSLLHPLRWKVALAVAVVVVGTALQVAGPALIAFGIDHGLPALRVDANWLPISLTVGVFLFAAVVGAAFAA